MHYRLTANCVLLSILTSTSALAQSTLGELFDSGAKKLSKDEVLSAVSGNTISGPSKSGGEFHADYKSDGSYTGYRKGYTGSPQPLAIGEFGTWTVDETGKWCTHFIYGGYKQRTNCGYLFRMGDQYYGSDSDTDRSAPVRLRTLQKSPR